MTNKYYILTVENGMLAYSFDSIEEAEKFGINGGWNNFIIIQPVKSVKL